MTLTLTQTATALGPNIQASFLGINGTSPYTYAVLSSGAGGSIDPTTGVYTAPAIINSDPKKLYDTIRVTDSLAATATARILVGSPLLLFCEIIQKELSLPDGRVYLWDQKIMQPTDNDLYVAVSVPSCKPFGNTNRWKTTLSGLEQSQFVSMAAQVEIDIISRGPSARDRKEEVIIALESNYARQQQDANSFYIGKLSTGFLNLSEADGAAIPYRYKISVAMQYAFQKARPIDYFDTFTLTEDVDP